MPEGHTVHRIANDFKKRFAGQVVEVQSPQGRFSAESQAISKTRLIDSKAIGKQLFLEFENKLTIRIHLGIYGKWTFASHNGELPEPVGQVRARFIGDTDFADLRGPTVCEVISAAQVKGIESRLGPDPLNPNPGKRESKRFIDRVQRAKTQIGLLLMDQAVISGIGNVYRAEILFRAGISPHRPGQSLSEDQIIAIWDDSVDLLKVGVKTGFMITRDELMSKNPDRADRNFVYKREGLPCRVCGTNVSIEIMAARKLYWCVGCQS